MNVNDTVEHSDGWHVARNGTCIRIRSLFDAIWMYGGDWSKPIRMVTWALSAIINRHSFCKHSFKPHELTSPSSCVIYFHWLSWIVLAIPFPWSLQWVGSYKVVAQFDRFLLGLSCKVQLGDILLQLHERNEIKVEQRLQEATMEVQYFSMVVTSCIFYFLLILSFNILSTTLCVSYYEIRGQLGPTPQVFGAFKENLLQVARSASLAARDSYTRAYQHLLRRVA